MNRSGPVVFGLLLLAAQAQGWGQALPLPPEIERQGAELYRMHCAQCHDHSHDARIPPRIRLSTSRSPEYVLRVLNIGAMRQQASALSADEKKAVAAYLIGRLPGSGSVVDLKANRCRHVAARLVPAGSSWNGWGGQGTHNLRYQPAPGLAPADIPRLELKWAFALPGGTSSQPTIVGGRLFVPSLAGVVFSLDADSGCTHWATDLGSPVRTAISVGALSAGKLVAYLGDVNGTVHALDAQTGRELWRTVVESHPARRLTGAPTLFEGRLYQPVSSFEETFVTDPNYVCCSSRGSLVALDAATGDILWQSYTIDESARPLPGDGHRVGPAGAAIWSAPTIDARRRSIYVGTGNAYTEPAATGANSVIAFDMRTGAKRWVKQIHARDVFVAGCEPTRHINCPRGEVGPDFDIGSSPLLVTMQDGTQLLIVTSKSGEVFGLDVEQQGRIVWQTRVGRGGLLGGIEWGGATDGIRLYVPVSDLGPGQSPSRPGLNALSLADGALLWHTAAPKPLCAWGEPCAAALASAPIVIPGVVFAGSFDGHARAYSAADGKVLWAFDTGASFDAVNGGKATGGSIDQGGMTLAGGRLFVSSGARLGHPGNALLAFSVSGK